MMLCFDAILYSDSILAKLVENSTCMNISVATAEMILCAIKKQKQSSHKAAIKFIT